jgi:hypothetical protein
MPAKACPSNGVRQKHRLEAADSGQGLVFADHPLSHVPFALGIAPLQDQAASALINAHAARRSHSHRRIFDTSEAMFLAMPHAPGFGTIPGSGQFKARYCSVAHPEYLVSRHSAAIPFPPGSYALTICYSVGSPVVGIVKGYSVGHD